MNKELKDQVGIDGSHQDKELKQSKRMIEQSNHNLLAFYEFGGQFSSGGEGTERVSTMDLDTGSL